MQQQTCPGRSALTHFGGDASQGGEIAVLFLSEVKFLETPAFYGGDYEVLRALERSSPEFLARL